MNEVFVVSEIKTGSRVRLTSKGFYDGLEGIVKAFVPAGDNCKLYMDKYGIPRSLLYSSAITSQKDRWLIELRLKNEHKLYRVYVCKTCFDFELIKD